MLFKPNYYIIFGRAFCNCRHAYAVNEFQKNEQEHNTTHLLHTNFRWRKKTWTLCHLKLKIIKMVPSNLHPVNKFQQDGQQVRCKALAWYQFSVAIKKIDATWILKHVVVQNSRTNQIVTQIQNKFTNHKKKYKTSRIPSQPKAQKIFKSRKRFVHWLLNHNKHQLQHP